MTTFAEGLMTAILLVFFLYLSMRPDKIRRRLCFVVGWGGIVLIFIGSFFPIGRSRSVGIVAQVFSKLREANRRLASELPQGRQRRDMVVTSEFHAASLLMSRG